MHAGESAEVCSEDCAEALAERFDEGIGAAGWRPSFEASGETVRRVEQQDSTSRKRLVLVILATWAGATTAILLDLPRIIPTGFGVLMVVLGVFLPRYYEVRRRS